MSRVLWSDGALADLARCLDYWEAHSVDAAQRAGADILEIAETLAAFPFLGRRLEGRGPDVRGFSIARWKKILVYRVREGAVEISALLDPRRES